MNHDHEITMDFFTREFWDERYAGSDQIWSGRANPHLVSCASALRPRTALDLGSGEGADVIWLAQQGWTVTGLDVSTVALERAAARAADAGVESRTTWAQADALTWTAGATYDLVSAQFMHLPGPLMQRLLSELAAAVAAGGTLLVVGHHPDDQHHAPEVGGLGDIRYTADEAAAALDPAEWSTIEPQRLQRAALDADGQPVILTDAVLRAVRRS